jgi:hypothetical protein
MLSQGMVLSELLDARRKVWYPRRYRLTSRFRSSASVASRGQLSQHPGDWKQLMAAAPCGLALLDRQAAVAVVNPAAAALLGIDPDASVGRPLVDLLPAWKDTPFHASLPSLLGGQATFRSVAFDVPGPPGKVLSVTAAPLEAEDGQPAGILLSVVECTQMLTLERRLQRAEHQASIGKLARGIAHELNSPLDGVLRYTHLALEQLTEDSPVREYLVHVKEGLDRMVRAVKAFLEFSRQVATPLQRVANLTQLIEDGLLLVQHRAKFQQVRIVKALDGSVPPVLDGGLQHAIVNLVKNAFDAMPRGGTLTISTRADHQDVVIEVEDTGSGIPESIRSRIFEPFFSTKPIHQGSGLGLVIAREVVERSGGTIEFSSRAGVGTTFRIRVPAAPPEGSNGSDGS